MRRLLEWLRSRLSTAAGDTDLARSAVLFAPHPDDETLGAGGTIIRKVRAGARVSLVFLTDGSRSHRHLMPAVELAAVRMREAQAAGSVLGVSDADLHFLGFEDGALAERRPEATARVAEILARLRPEEVLLPYAGEAPADHRATYDIVVAALSDSGLEPVLLEYPVWFWNHWPFAAPEVRCRAELLDHWKHNLKSWRRLLADFRYDVDVRDVLAVKRAALEQHRSQLDRLVDDPRWLTFADVAGGAWLECFFREREIFRRRVFRAKKGGRGKRVAR